MNHLTAVINFEILKPILKLRTNWFEDMSFETILVKQTSYDLAQNVILHWLASHFVGYFWFAA